MSQKFANGLGSDAFRPSTVFERLTKANPVSLAELPEDFGVYALWDHTCQIRYIGCTPKATEGFRKRIFSKHAAGSEGRSHKFSQAYCCGRMWRYCKTLHPKIASVEQRAVDADAAKKLRNAFIRKYCKATYVAIPRDIFPAYSAGLISLESQLQHMAPPSMREWEGTRFVSALEPSLLVDRLLNEFPQFTVGAERQHEIYAKYILGIAA